MKSINLNWQGPIKFSNWEKISNEQGVYLHTVTTNINERITYVGKGDLFVRQRLHMNNLKNANCGFFDYLEIKDTDYYDNYTNDKYIMSVYNMLNLEHQKNVLNWRKSKGEKYFENNFNLIENNSNIYFAELEGYSEIDLKSIECNIQYYLIKKFKLDVYSNGNYKIGFNNTAGQNEINTKLKIINNLDLITDKLIFENHFLNQDIDLSKETLSDVDFIKKKRLDQNWIQNFEN